MVKYFSMLLVVVLATACARIEAEPPVQAVHVVQEAKTTVDRFTGIEALEEFAVHLKDAQGVVVLPTVYKAGFIGAGEGGNGVLMARNSDGTWGYPAFYTLGAASVGIQAGIQSTEIVLVIRNREALKAIIEDQAKFGADAGLTMAVIGVGVEGSTTTNAGADVLAFANSKVGLYGGVSLEGAALIRRKDLNEAFYQAGATPSAIVLEGRYQNPNADGLRQSLLR